MIKNSFQICSKMLIVIAIIIIGLFILTGQSFAEEKSVISYEYNGDTIETIIKDDVHYLYLPNDKGIDVNTLSIQTTKPVKKFDKGVFSSISSEEGKYIYSGDFSQFDSETQSCYITFEDGTSIKLVVIKSNLPSVTVRLKETTLDVIISGSKNIKYKGNSVAITDADGNLSAEGIDNVEIKGRGNSTWRLDKKPYQIKFDSKTSVLGMTKAKKWVLLANYLDGSLLRNKIAYDLADDAGIKGSLSSQSIDLWIDGIYQGNYLICQKVDSGSGNLALSDNGILAELDNIHYEEEDDWFFSERSDSYFTIKECNSDTDSDAIFNNFEKKVNEFERYLYAENKNWNKISEVINEESFAKMYLLFEYTENEDAMKSSVYFHWDGEELFMGPAWDFDRSLGNGNNNDPYSEWLTKRAEKDVLLSTYFNELKKIPEFNELVEQEYYENFQPALEKAISNVKIYSEQINLSNDMNQMIWPTYGKRLISSMKPIADNYQDNIEELSSWMSARKTYMDKAYEVGYISGEIPVDGYYTFSSYTDKDSMLGVGKNGEEYIDDVSSEGIKKANQFRIEHISGNDFNVKSLSSGNKSKKIITDAGNGYYYIQDKDGRYLTYDGSNVIYKSIDEKQLGNNQKWVLYKTAVKTVDDGVYSLSSVADKKLKLSIEGGSVDNRANVVVASDNNRAEQLFEIKYSGDGYYTIKSERSGYVLDVANGSTASGANIWQYTENGSDSQLWTFEENIDGSYTIVSKKGTVVAPEVISPVNGTNVVAVLANGTDNQKWKLNSPAKSVEDGNYEIVNYKNTDRILGIKNNTVRLFDKKSDSFSFEISWDENTQAYTIMSEGKAFTFYKGSKVHLKDYTGDESQLWYIESVGDGTYIIRCKMNGIIATSSETMKSGSYIRLLTPSTSEAVRWKIKTPVAGDYTAEVESARNILFDNEENEGTSAYKVRRFAGAERYGTAMSIANGLKKNLSVDKFDSIIVASGENYPDALSGSSLVRSKDQAPVLLIGKSTENEIISYIKSNLSENGRVYLLGGPGVISDGFENKLKSIYKNSRTEIIRLYGVNRYLTNLEILKASGLEGEELIICSGNGYADSLSASATGNPILLVDNSLTYTQQQFIETNLKPSKITLIGGPSVVSESIEANLKKYANKNDIELRRIYGDTRYETSMEIAKTYFSKESCDGVVTIAYGDNFPDGLAGSSLTMSIKSPLILVTEDRVNDIKPYIASYGMDKVVILGGIGVISDKAVKNLMAK